MTINYKIPFYPLSKQKQFLGCNENIVLYSGAFGAGKSYTICVAVILEALKYNNNRCLILRKRNVDLNYSTMKSFFELMPITNKLIKSYHKSKQTITLINGSEIIFGGLDKAEKWGSTELGCFAIDEASEITEADFNMLISRLRKSGVDRHRGFLACNPSSKAHFLYKMFFDDRERYGYGVVETTSMDNTYLPKSTIDRYKAWEETNPDYYRRYILGEWGSFEGLVYSTFSLNKNVKDFAVDKSWKFFRSIDWGYENPFVCLYIGLDNDDNIYVFDEIYGNHLLLTDVISLIKRTHSELKFDHTFADPSGKQNIAEFRSNGIEITPAKNDVEAGLQSVMDRLNKITVHSRCVNTIREFQSYKWSTSHSAARSEVPTKEDDHTMDSLRYMVYTHFKRSIKPLLIKKGGIW